MFTINLNDGGNGDQPPPSDGAAKMPDWGRHLAQMAQSLSAIQKSVASIQATAQQILGSLNRTGGGTAASATRASRGAVKDAINVQRIFRVDPSKAIVPMRNVTTWAEQMRVQDWVRRPADAANLSRFVNWAAGGYAASASSVGDFVDVESTVIPQRMLPLGGAGEAAGVVSPDPSSGTPSASGKRPPRAQKPPKPGKGAKPRRIAGFVGAGRFGSAILYSINNLGLGGTAIGAAVANAAPAVALVSASVLAYQMLNNAGDRAMRHSAGLSPAVAGLQAQVDVNRLMVSMAAANSPITIAAATFKRNTELSLRDADTGFAILTGSGEMTLSALGKAAIARGTVLGWISTILGHIQNQRLRQYMDAGGFNSLFEKDIDAMVGGMLSMQDSMRVDGIKGNRSINTWERGTWFSKKKWVQKGRVR